MSDKINPSGSNNFTTVDLLPKYYQTDDNKKFLQATLDQLAQKGTAKKVNGFIGRKNAKSASGKDIYVSAVNSTREHYQLEPSVVIKDSSDNVTFFKDYQDYINQLNIFGGNTLNHERLNRQEFYSWDPHIDWDKFVNFQQYYWLPYGPDLIRIKGQQLKVASTYTVELGIGVSNTKDYIFTPNGIDRDPTLTLYRGQTYYFEVTSPGEPFSFKTSRTLGTTDRYTDGGYIDTFGVTSGTIKFEVPMNSPDTLYYVSENDPDLGGLIKFADIDENSYIDVSADILGKKTYTLSNGTPLSNGMKVSFEGNVAPASYATGEYYVEGVGTAIKLIPTSILEIISAYTSDVSVLFDTTLFDQYPFASAETFAGNLDYLVVNRSSVDRNPWSRYNRWFHKDTIAASAEYNGKLPDYDQATRALRPIIEFDANLKLFNFGSVATADIDLVDVYTTDVFSTIEGTAGYNVDGTQLSEGMRVLFLADTDSLVKNNVYTVKFVNLQNGGIGVPQIHLELDETPSENVSAIIRSGSKYQGSTFWYTGSEWKLSQQKTKVNQSPLFDLFDADLISFADYSGSTFKGTKIFSYKEGTTGTNDSKLGFKLSYQNINNIGDILFDFNLLTDTFEYKDTSSVVTKVVNTGYLSKLSFTNTPTYVNGWQKSNVTRYQPAVRVYKDSNLVNNFPLDIYDNKSNLSDLEVRVFINGIRVDSSLWTLVDAVNYKQVKLVNDIALTDVLTIKAFAKQSINANGYYELPINLQNNPLNADLGSFTLGEVTDHVNSIVDNIQSVFNGVVSGSNNLRDLGNVTQYGTKFVQHSGPTSLALYHVTSEKNNIVKSIEKSRDDYGKFKRNFLTTAFQLGEDANIVNLVDIILQKLSANKTNQSPYYFSDMVPFGGKKVLTYTVEDLTISAYPLSKVFNNDELSSTAVAVYINNVQVLYEHDYTFTTTGYVDISKKLAEGDVITIYEYDSTDGSYVPSTPTKLGLWPKFEPKLYKDTSLLTPRWMIQGHDGSQTLAYGTYDTNGTADYRDDLILELEKRIYNNLQVKYDPSIFDIYNIVPGYYRDSDYTVDEFNSAIAPGFYKWATLAGQDFSKPAEFIQSNTFTHNYRNHTAPDGRNLPGYWRGIYRWVYDTDRPHMCPWEMLGFFEEPLWWQEVYGPAPYTSNNTIMWKDLAQGAVKEPGVPVEYRTQFARPDLENHIPVDENGRLVSPVVSRFSSSVFTTDATGNYVTGDVGPVESAWRRSSYYPFTVLSAAMLLKPAYTFATCLDRSRTIRNICGQLVYKDTGLRVKPADIVLPSIYTSSTRKFTSGIINYLIDLLTFNNVQYYSDYQYNLDNLSVKLSYRLAGFSSKENFNLILDSKNPASSGNVFVPQENYSVVYNNSSPIKKLSYSGVIVTRVHDGFEIKGYSTSESFFRYYPPMQKGGVSINVGGISAPYVTWTPNKTYTVGQIVSTNGRYYRTIFNTVSQEQFDTNSFALLPSLPVVGGETAIFRKSWDNSTELALPYGSILPDVQSVVDFLLGYGEYLTAQGFVFDTFNNTLAHVSNWQTSSKEFMFWTTQKWSTGQDKWDDWTPNTSIAYGAIVKYNNTYYRALINSQGTDDFVEENFEKLDGLSTIGSAVISLSPGATSLTFVSELSVADDISNPFNEYEIFKVDGTGLNPIDLNVARQGNLVTYTPDGANTIYNASFYLVQKEQVLIIDNTTVFNDIIYHPESGYRQERIKMVGFVSSEWFGGFEIPGFIFDRAEVSAWSQWTDYSLGDIVKFQGFYYSANAFVPGSSEFTSSSWTQISKPTPKLLPNWNYKANQFEDFYDLDNSSFDTGQQSIAQHLIGYQPRQYLSNIIQDEISEYQFYQGMIREKGTQNSLNKLFDVLSSSNKESLSFYEEWALRVGQYGASKAFDAIEFVLPQVNSTKNSQGYYLTIQPVDENNFNVNIPYNDVYLKPDGYNAEPWPVNNDQRYYLRTPGHIESAENVIQLGHIDEITSVNISSVKEGTYIWTAFDKTSWNIFRFTTGRISPVSVAYNSAAKQITITTETQLDPAMLGQYIGLSQVDFAGFYLVTDVQLNSFTVPSDTPINQQDPEVIKAQLAIFRLYPARANSIDDANSILKSYTKPGDKIWIDKDADGKWATLELESLYSQGVVKKPYPVENMEHGSTVVMNSEGTLAAVSTSIGEVVTYEKQGTIWVFKQLIKQPFIYHEEDELENFNTLDMFGESLAMSADGEYLAIGIPRAGKLATIKLANGNVVCDASALNATTLQTGAVSLYQKSSYNEYNLLYTIASGDNVADQQFGYSLTFGDKKLFVGSRGNTNYGAQAAVFEIRYVSTTGDATATSSLNADAGDANATVTVIYDSGASNTLYTGAADVQFDGGPALVVGSLADRWVLTRPGISIIDGATAGFGLQLSVSQDNQLLAISAPYSGNVYVYKQNLAGIYTLLQTITGTTVELNVPTNTDGVVYFDNLTLNGGKGFKEQASDLITSYVENLETVSANGTGLIVDATVDAVGTITHVHVRNAGNNYNVGDSVTIVNPLGNGSVTGFDLNLLANTNFTDSSTEIITDVVSTTGSGVGLELQVVSTKTSGANLGDIDIPVPSIANYQLGGQLFSNVSNVFGKIFNSVAGTNVSSTGNGAKFDITASDSAYLIQVAVTNEGFGTTYIRGASYAVNDTIRILGTQLGGTSPANDAVITVSTINVSGGILTATIAGASSFVPKITELNLVDFTGTVEGNTLTVSAITGGNDEIVSDIIAEIKETTLTIYEIAGEPIIVGMTLTGTGVVANTTIVSGSGYIWTVSNSQTITLGSLKATLPGKFKVGMQLTNPLLDGPVTFDASIEPGIEVTFEGDVVTMSGSEASFAGSVHGIYLTLSSDSVVGEILPNMVVTSSTAGAIVTGTKIVSGSGRNWQLDTSQTSNLTTAINNVQIIDTAGTLKVTSGTYTVGQAITITGGLSNGVIEGYTSGTTYYIGAVNSTTEIQITSSYANAVASTPVFDVQTPTGIASVDLSIKTFAGMVIGSYTIPSSMISPPYFSWGTKPSLTLVVTSETDAYVVVNTAGSGYLTPPVVAEALGFVGGSGGVPNMGTGTATVTVALKLPNVATPGAVFGLATSIQLAGKLAAPTIVGNVLTFGPTTSTTNATVAEGMILSGGTVLAGTKVISGQGNLWYVDKSQTATCTTATSPFATITGNILTFGSSTATPKIGMALVGGTVELDTFISDYDAQNDIWTVNNNQFTTCTTATNLVTFIDGVINGTSMSYDTKSGAPIEIGMVLSGGTVTAGTYIVSGSGTEWTVSPPQTATFTTATPVIMTVVAPVSSKIRLGQTLKGGSITNGTVVVAAKTVADDSTGTYFVTPIQTRGTLLSPIAVTAGYISPSTYITALGSGTGGLGTYTINQDPGGVPTRGTSLTINAPLIDTLVGNSEVNSLNITTQGFAYRVGDQITFNAGGTVGTVTTKITGVANDASIVVAKIGNGATMSDTSQFGASIAFSPTGEYLAIGNPMYSGTKENEGQVLVYSNSGIVGNIYSQYQTITSPSADSGNLFGSSVAFTNNYNTLLVYSPNADNLIPTTFDEDQLVNSTFTGNSTTFDAGISQFKEVTPNSGRINIFDRYNLNWVSGETLSTDNNTNDGFGQSFAASNNVILVSAPHETDVVLGLNKEILYSQLNVGKLYNYEKVAGKQSWKTIHRQADLVDLKKIKQAFLYNKVTNQLVTYLDIVDPILGKIPATAEQELSYKTFYDPAVYTVGTEAVNVDSSTAWTNKNVGKLWWDLRTAKFIDNHADSILYRNSMLSTLAAGASIDVYEWIETKFTPTEWAKAADTPNGLTRGISGTPLYTDSYSIKQSYDTFTKTFSNTYYYWVKNKSITPAFDFRKLSANEVATLIGNPRGAGYKFLALTGKDTFSLVNCDNLLSGSDVVLGVEYWLVDNTTQNIHAQWKLVDNNPSTSIPKTIEEKWFDSLCGKDQADRPVPDLNLPAKIRYGIESRPRQGMFINSYEALKQFVEHANSVLIKEQIVEQKNISKLESYDAIPNKFAGEYDVVIDTDAELRLVPVSTAKTATIVPVIENGSIISITITSAGSGYKTNPTIIINGTGKGAKLKSVINAAGQLTAVEVIAKGKGYTDTTLTVRPFSVLAQSDSYANGAWSIYSYNSTTKVWTRVKTQAYDVRNYWNYADWYDAGYSQFTSVDYSIDTLAEIGNIDPVVGQTVKVRSAGALGWYLLVCYSAKVSVPADWTSQYKVIGIEKGTIQLSSSLYSFQDNNIGFDGSIYDNVGFDYTASRELRIILNTLRDNVLTDTLKQAYLDLFFSSVRYAHTEQTYIDWAFKTSFVKAQHNVGELKQTVTYKNDNLSNFQDYINEVVPYRTTVREYVSNYNTVDTSSAVVTDFDLPAVYKKGTNEVISTKIVNGKVEANNSIVQTYPWKNWISNLGFEITSLVITDHGAGYVNEPTVRIISDSGSGATARAFIANGKVNRIILLTPGSGYLAAPEIIIDGGITTTSTPAKAVAIIGNSITRSSLMKIKFDRTTSTYHMIQLDEAETFQGTGNRTNFALKWAPDIKIGSSSVTIQTPGSGAVLLLRDDYTLTVAKTTAKGYTSYYGILALKTAPVQGAIVTVKYLKDISLLNASDRIQYFYDPATGQLGKELSQLMTGVDYGGVQVTGVDYSVAQGWGSIGYMSDLWDSYENTYNDYTVTIDSTTSSSHEFLLPYLPEQLTQINVYYAQVVRNTYVADGIESIYTIGSNYTTIDLQSSIVKSVVGATTSVTNSSIDRITVTGTIAGFNFIRASTANLTVDKAITFSGTMFGGIVAGQTYYVKSIRNENTFTMSISINGEEYIVTTATGSMTMQYATPNNRLTGSTTSLAPKMAIQFSGVPFAGLTINKTYFVKSVISPTEFTISETVNGNVVSLPTSSGLMSIQEVAATGSTTVKLTSTAGLKVGDALLVSIASAIADGTVITKINSNSEITISNILYGALLAGTQITFRRTLVAPIDYRYLTNTTLQLTEPVYAGGELTISSPLDPIRIDDENYTKVWIITKTEADTNIITTITPITFAVGDTIKFAGALGGIESNFTYYVKSILTNRTFTISGINGGPTYEVSNATGSISAVSRSNLNAVMGTYIADGTEPKVFIPRTFDLPVGDLMIFRKSTSDGSITVSDNDIDSAIDGGNLVYSSATGLSPDDIILDGDGYVTQTSSGAPEEVVPGQVVDAVAIKVYDRPSDGSATVKSLSYVADGVSNKFNVGQFPNSKQAVVVKLNDTILNLGTDYYMDYPNRQVVLNSAPVEGQVVTVNSFGFNGSNILDVDYFVADGTTKEFITKAPYLDTDFTYLVYLDGVAITPTLFKTDTTYESSNRIGFRFSIPPTKFAILNYLIVSGAEQTYSIFKTEKLATNGSNSYTLTNTVGSSLPLESSVIVRANQQILTGPNTSYFTIASNQYTYTLDQAAVQPYSINTTDVTVYADGNLLQFITDYSVDTSGVSVSINKLTYSKYKGKRLVISIVSQQDYNIVGNTITFKDNYTSNDYVEVISAYKHDILQVQRTKTKATNNLQFTTKTPSYYKYIGILGGKIELPTTITTESQLWLTKNKTLLVNGIDFRLTPELNAVVLDMPPGINDEFEAIIFAGSPVRPGLSYMQFKDMLNRTVYKRLSALKQDELAQDLHYYDSTIVVKDAGNFDKPNPNLNKPGVVEINGERIEYFTIKNNTVLGQLRRGTLGTGVPKVHGAGSKVQDIGPSETIPYSDTTKTEQITINGSTADLIIPLSFVPTKTATGAWTKSPSNFNLFDSAEIAKFINKTGTGPYAVKFAVAQQDFAPAIGKQLVVAGNTTSYNGNYSVIEADITNQNHYVPLAIADSTVNGTSIVIEFSIATQTTAPETGIYYSVTGAVPLEYNSTWLCTASTTSSITLTVSTNYGAISTLPTQLIATNTITVSYPTDPGTFDTSMVSTISAPVYGQSDNIDVFVGGYDESTVWAPNTVFEAEQIVTINSYTYRMTARHRSGATFNSAVTTLETDDTVISTNVPATAVRAFFIGNIRLKKHPYSVYNVENASTSPEGDVAFDADFAVDGANAELVLLNKLVPGTVVTVIRKTGKTWTENNEDLQVSQTKIAKFITSVPGVWVTGNQTTAKNIGGTSNATLFDNITKTFDGNSTTFDQGN